MAYKTTRHVGYAGKIREPGTRIVFRAGDEAIRDRLLELGAIVGVAGEDKAEHDGPKPLAEMSAEELAAIAKAEKVKAWGQMKGDADKLRAAIEAHRAAQAQA